MASYGVAKRSKNAGFTAKSTWQQRCEPYQSLNTKKTHRKSFEYQFVIETLCCLLVWISLHTILWRLYI